MQRIREMIVDQLASRVSFPKTRFLSLFKQPDNAERGDLALPCFPFAKELKMKPDAIAAEFAEQFQDHAWFTKVEAAGPFLNFTYSGTALAKEVLPAVFAAPDRYGNSGSGDGQTVVLDFSSPNIAKPIAFHHIRSTVIGNALANLHEACGYRTVRINYLGDWGTQFGKLIVAYRRWGSEEELKTKEIRHLLDIYVRFHQEVETEPTLEEEARAWFKRMEDGDDEALALWRLFYDISMREFERIYSLLGVRFDHFEGESFYRKRLDETIEQVTQRAGTAISQGALVVDLEEDKLPPCLLRKADGATLYATRDIAAAMDRFERFGFERSLYVVANQQATYFKQLIRVLSKMEFDWAARITHINFGMLQLADQTMSTRKGQVIFLEDVLKKSIELSQKAIDEKNPDLANKEEVARQVGVGAIIFGDLVNRRTNDITFEWDRILNFQGETGVYVQYTHARCRSMLRKAGVPEPGALAVERLAAPEEKDVLKVIGQFPDRVQRACDDFDPSLVARHLIELCRSFNKLYNVPGYRFLDDDTALRATRLLLAQAVADVLKRGLDLLGVATPEEM